MSSIRFGKGVRIVMLLLWGAGLGLVIVFAMVETWQAIQSCLPEPPVDYLGTCSAESTETAIIIGGPLRHQRSVFNRVWSNTS